MAETVGSHTIATFTSPVNGTTPIDANSVRGNDNVIQTSYNAHDSDPGIHVQSSALASRPAAATAGRKWMTVDSTVARVWYDTGSVWLESQASALSTARTLWGQSFDGSANVSGSLSSVTDIGMSGTLTIGADVALSRGAASRLDLASGDSLNLVSGAYQISGSSVLSATTLGGTVVNSSLTSVGTLTSGAIGAGFTAIPNTALANSAVTVNGTSIALGASGTVAAAAGTLTGSTLASNVTASSLTSVGTLSSLTVSGAATFASSSGNVGIGTTTATDTDGFGKALDIRSVGGGQVIIRDSDDLTRYGRFAYDGTDNSTWLEATGAGSVIRFRTAGSQKMLLDASGNLGLGVTPQAWATANGQRALQITQFLGLWTGANGGSSLGFNAYESGVNAYTYSTNNPASLYQQSSGAHMFYTAGSGTGGNPIGFGNAKMTLDASGNLLVGLTSTIGAAKAAIAGTVLSSTNTLSTFSGAYGGFDWVSRSLRIFSGTADATNSQIEFYAGVSGGVNERFRIKGPGQVRFLPLGAAPTTNVEDGDVYYDSGTNKLRVRAGGAWVDLH